MPFYLSFFGRNRLQKIGYPYSNLSTGGPSSSLGCFPLVSLLNQPRRRVPTPKGGARIVAGGVDSNDYGSGQAQMVFQALLDTLPFLGYLYFGAGLSFRKWQSGRGHVYQLIKGHFDSWRQRQVPMLHKRCTLIKVAKSFVGTCFAMFSC